MIVFVVSGIVCLALVTGCEWGIQCSMLRIFTVFTFVFIVLVHGNLFGQSMVCGCMGKSLVCIGYVSSFTLCWLSLFSGFKGFIGKRLFTLRFSFGAH